MINQDDIIYFVVTDRFADGDINNNFGVDKTQPKRFHGGDFAGLVQKAPYLKKLGVTALWITPVYLNISSFDNTDPYHYYWALDFDKIDPHLYSSKSGYEEGTKLYLRDLVEDMKKFDIKIVLDMVVNHAGYNTENIYDRNWFQHGTGEIEGPLAGLPDFDHDNPNVIDFFINNILDWIEETGIQAIRMDTAKHVESKFWNAFKAQIKGAHPNLTLIGEVLYEDKHMIPEIAKFQRYYDFDSLFDFPLRTVIKDTVMWDFPMTEIARPGFSPNEPFGVLDLDNPFKDGYSNANRLVTLLDNHDLDKRIMSHARQRFPGDEGMHMAFKVMKLALALQLTVRGIPQLYYGIEVGLEGWRNGGDDADLRRDFPWELFDADFNPASGLSEMGMQQIGLFDYTKNLIQLRKNNPALRFGTSTTLWVDQFIFAFVRYHRNNVVLVVINNGLNDMQEPLALPVYRYANNMKNNQLLPDRILDLMTKNGLTEFTDSNAKVNIENDHILVKIAGKTARIFTLE